MHQIALDTSKEQALCEGSIEEVDGPALIVSRATSRLVDCTQQFAELLQQPRALLIGQPIDGLLRDESASGTMPGVAQSRVVARRSDGHAVRFLRFDVAGRHGGQPVWFTTLVDMTEEDGENDLLRQERNFLERVVQTIPASIFVKDLSDKGRYVLCTGTTEDMSNLPVNTVLGATDVELFSPQTAAVFASSDREVVDTGRIVISEMTVCHPDGRVMVTETKKMPLPEYGRSTRYILGLTEDISHRREMEMRLARLAMRDSLTGLANRALFRDKLRAALASRQQCGGYVVLHSLDLDHFKGVNDTLGHAAGDYLLAAVAGRIEAACNGLHTVARLGGDEFAVIQGPIASLEEAVDLAGRMSKLLNQPISVDGRPLVIGSSAGLAVAPDHGDDPDTLLRSADVALYGSKEHGRGTYRFFDTQLAQQMQLRNRMEEDLREALAKRQFELHYQPIVGMVNDRVVSYEALLRWIHPVHGTVSPSVIVPLAEESGLIVHLGEWILEEACREAAAWPDEMRVSVNLSPVQFGSPGLADSVEAALTSSGLAPERLELEITESVLLTDSPTNLDTLHRLRSLGVKISLDDFGTGYSSLGYLNAFPFHKIKIDRSFVRDIGSSRNGLAIVRSVIKLAHDLGMSTTAEGVETVDQLEKLRREGCTEAQGYLFGHPRPALETRESMTAIDSRAA